MRNEQGYLDFVCPHYDGKALTLLRFGDGGGNPPTVEDDITDQLPYGDFTPGRYAWLLADPKLTTERCPACEGRGWLGLLVDDEVDAECPTCHGKGTCAPIPAKGRQRLWEWTPPLVQP